MASRCAPYCRVLSPALFTRPLHTAAPRINEKRRSGVVYIRERDVRRLYAATTQEETAEEPIAVQDADYAALQSLEAWLVSSQTKVAVTSLWQATEKCVLVFARSMGCCFCQEYARQLKRDVLPRLEGTGIRLFLISIGPPERGIEFSELTGFPKTQLLADQENALYDAVGLVRNVQQTFFDIRTPLRIFGRAFKQDRGADLVEATLKWKPWIPPKSNQALQQGGILIFDGPKRIFKHVDQATADHFDLEELVKILLEES